MSGVRVVTDSASDLSDELTAATGITVVPLTIRFGEEELVDRRDLSPADFWQRCRSSAALPETAAPSPGDFRAAFEAAADDGADGVLCVTISSELSATYQAALAGAQAVAARVPVRVVDSRSVTMGEGLLCLAGAQAALAGAPLDGVASTVEELIGRTHVLGVLGSLDHLHRGGRIGGAADDVEAVVGRLAEVEVAHDLVVVDLGPTVGTHAGPGTVGVCYQLPPGRGSGATH